MNFESAEYQNKRLSYKFCSHLMWEIYLFQVYSCLLWELQIGMKRNIGPSRDERRETEWQDVVSDVEEPDVEGKGGVKEDAETGKAEKDSTFGILENSTVSDLDSNRTGSSIMIALGTWGASLISLLGVTPTSKQAQTIYMGFMLVLSLVPILALVIQNGTSLNEVLKQDCLPPN